MVKRVLDEDLVRVYGARWDGFKKKVEKNKVVHMLYWGDTVDIVDIAQNGDTSCQKVNIKFYYHAFGKKVDGYVKKRKKNGKYQPLRFRTGPVSEKHLLEVLFVDVQQGDATLIRTPDRKTILVDGGEQKFIARVMAALFPGTTAAKPHDIDALVISHGDADHFTGLIEMANSINHQKPRKRFHASIQRYFHNGLVKAARRPKPGGGTKAPPTNESFGKFKKVGREVYATDLWGDPRNATDKSDTFKEWDAALNQMLAANAEVRRLSFGDDDAFDAFRPQIDIKVLGPIEEQLNGESALPFLKNERNSRSASHTINGHSIVLQMRYGNVGFMFGGDLNTHAGERIREHIANLNTPAQLRSEVLKVPHHGSHEFDPGFLELVQPVVSVVSSGDESVMKEYVHPRANLLAALGRYSRGDQPLVFSTELAAFFAYRGAIQPELHDVGASNSSDSLVALPKSKQRGWFHAFQRLVFGAIRVRTDGRRVLVAVESASSSIKESYVFEVDALGRVLSHEAPSVL